MFGITSNKSKGTDRRITTREHIQSVFNSYIHATKSQYIYNTALHFSKPQNTIFPLCLMKVHIFYHGSHNHYLYKIRYVQFQSIN